MCRRIYSSFFALFFAVTSLSAMSEEISVPLPTITEGALANGLRYTLVPLQAEKGRIDVRLSVEAGSLDETDDQSGVAHMVEHMVFRASDAWPQGVSTVLATQGWKRGAHYNAVTNYERTQYMMSPPDGVKGLNTTLHALSQMTAHARITQQDLDDERQVILEEWRGKLGVANRMNVQRIAALREGSRYPTRVTIGKVESIEHTPASVLMDFYRRWYHPGNMRLLIIGDFNPETVRTQIANNFASLPHVAVPLRDDSHYNQQLKKQLRVVSLQDSESGGSQISWVYRFAEPKLTSPEGFRQRLINQIIQTSLSRQLKRQRSELPSAVGNVVVRKADIGRHTYAFGLFADVIPGEYAQGLETVLRERERLKRYGLDERDITAVKNDIREAALRLCDKPESRTFSEWVRILATDWQNNTPYVGTQQRGKSALSLLDNISVNDVNTRLKSWLQAPDQLVQFSIPGKATFTPPDAKEIEVLADKISKQPLSPTQWIDEKPLPPLPELNTAGKRLSVKNWPKENVQEWSLSNGDRIVWLRNPELKDQIWLRTESHAGYMGQDLEPWRAQLASQLIGQGAPTGWREEDYTRWKMDHGLMLNINQNAETLEISATVKRHELNNLLHVYSLLHTDTQIDAESMKNSVMMLARREIMQKDSSSSQRAADIAQLRFGKEAFTQPTTAQFSQLTIENLTDEWKKISAAPVTYYIMAEMPETELKKAVEYYLAGINRGNSLPPAPYKPLSGQREKSSNLNIEPKAEVRIWSYTDQAWSPERAVQVSIARNLINQQLKAALRDDARGVYNLMVSGELNDKIDRVESELRFSSSPNRSAELARRAQQVLSKAAAQITQQDIEEQKVAFRRGESSRQGEIMTLQRRLMLSYHHYNDPSYLSRLKTLESAITLEGVREMATRLYNPNNLVIYTVLPQGKS